MKVDVEKLAKIKEALTGYYVLTPTSKDTYFTNVPCQLCGSILAGNRYEFTAMKETNKAYDDEFVTLDCCVDCFGYLFT